MSPRGMLDIEELKGGIAEGAIDTVLVVVPDMQGRLVGKRVTGHFFLDSIMHEMHACDYLLAVDIDMEPVASPATSPRPAFAEAATRRQAGA